MIDTVEWIKGHMISVQGLLARAYLYKGDNENALIHANNVFSSNCFALNKEV